MAFASTLASPGEPVLSPAVVPFPRGFAFGHDGILFLASGLGPGGEGDDTILAFGSERRMFPSWKVVDRGAQPARSRHRAERKRGREQRASVRRSGCGNDGPRTIGPTAISLASCLRTADGIRETAWSSLDRTASSTARHKTKSSRSISRRANVWARSSVYRA